jgi:putative (di)nucleoside polyphosphate hydrolase
MSAPPAAPRPEDLPYRPCVGIFLVNAEGLVFAGRRIDASVESWQMPQGGIDAGETPIEAALREMGEEIGTDKAEVVRERDEWLTYDLPPHLIGVALHGRFRGQKQKWIALRFTGVDADFDLETHDPEFAEWKWLAPAEIMRRIVPFKREVYEKVFAGFADLVKKD